MPLKKTNKPIFIIALPPCATWPELEELEAQGNKVIRVVSSEAQGKDDFSTAVAEDDILGASIILGPTCWRMTEKHRPYLKLAVAEARKRIK